MAPIYPLLVGSPHLLDGIESDLTWHALQVRSNLQHGAGLLLAISPWVDT
jgi:hypothetical protein